MRKDVEFTFFRKLTDVPFNGLQSVAVLLIGHLIFAYLIVCRLVDRK